MCESLHQGTTCSWLQHLTQSSTGLMAMRLWPEKEMRIVSNKSCWMSSKTCHPDYGSVGVAVTMAMWFSDSHWYRSRLNQSILDVPSHQNTSSEMTAGIHESHFWIFYYFNKIIKFSDVIGLSTVNIDQCWCHASEMKLRHWWNHCFYRLFYEYLTLHL